MKPVTAIMGTVAALAAVAVLLIGGCAAVQSSVRRTPAAEYLAIANAGNSRLETDFDRLDGRDRGRPAAADADLRDAAATERLFDRRLAAIAFPPGIEPIARRLLADNEARANLTVTASTAATPSLLEAFESRLMAANSPVERDVKAIRGQLGLPPPQTS